MDSNTLTELLAAYFQDTPVALVCAYLFGSYARLAQRPASDVDVAVLLPSGAPTGLAGPLTTLRGDLERLLHRQVDLIDMRRAPADLVHRILKDGQVLVERDRDERVRFEVQARNEYFDLLPYLHRYRRGRAA